MHRHYDLDKQSYNEVRALSAIISAYLPRWKHRTLQIQPSSAEGASALWRKRLQNFVEEHSWVEAFAHSWRRREHINSFEAAAVLLGLEWGVSHPITGSRILLLSGSMVVIGALPKGRSSSERLSLYCRRVCAILIAHDVSRNNCYVPLECNPADGPSLGRPVRNFRLFPRQWS